MPEPKDRDPAADPTKTQKERQEERMRELRAREERMREDDRIRRRERIREAYRRADVFQKLDRLKQFILLLGSPVDGEVLAAARALNRLLKDGGRDLHDLVDAITFFDPTALGPTIERLVDGKTKVSEQELRAASEVHEWWLPDQQQFDRFKVFNDVMRETLDQLGFRPTARFGGENWRRSKATLKAKRMTSQQRVKMRRN